MARSGALLHLPRCMAIDIEFSDVTYHVEQSGSPGRKKILHEISGKFLSGELTAIMGPSGAGKSSFLNILTGFRTTGAGGTVRCGDQGAQAFRERSRYIMQDDELCPLFTVQEIMRVAASCKLGRQHSAKTRQLVVDDILEAMGLENTKETACGKLSGGQKKRLSIALELIDNPPVLFLDEPTSGLDSSSSLQVVSLLKTLARGGRTIVCTIHQPCSKALGMFDHVYVIAEGRCVYQGSSDNIVPYLGSLGLDCPRYHNPADFVIEVASGEQRHVLNELAEAANNDFWRKPYESIPVLEIELGGDKKSCCESAVEKFKFDARPPSELEKFPVLMNRCFIQLYRDWTVTHLKCIMHVVVGVLVGCNYQNMGSDASKTVSNFAYYMCTITYLIFSSMMPSILRFPSEMSVLKKEKLNRWYCLRTYYLAVLISSIPVQVMFCAVHISVTYLLTAQPLCWSRFTMFLLTCIVTTLVGDSIGLLFGTLFNPVNGTFLGSVVLCFMLLFGGFLCLISDMPHFIRWMSYLSTFRYSAAGMALSAYDFGRTTVPCPASEVYCHLREPRVILRTFSAEEGEYWFNMGVLIAFLVFFRATGFFSLRMRVKSS
ncbi:ATP-binding cassette sub-family G member 1-like [Bacillus rossius redtenbacheri]|uniref:ATP-binding cassette sub-family G member 1-like n=1 Tax=Bacillus rossius redtenbacheri TaxID=93214 RepID=UPI002FDCFF94